MHSSQHLKPDLSWTIQTLDAQDPKTPQLFSQSLQETGFAVIQNHQIPQELCQRVLQDWQAYFAQPEEIKSKDHHSLDPLTLGWYPYLSENSKGYTAKNLMEFFHYRTVNPLPAGIGEDTLILFEKLTQLAHKLLDWLYASLPEDIKSQLSGPLVDLSNLYSPSALLRLIYYPALAGQQIEPGAVRSAQHEDIDLLTLLCGASAPGLQVLDNFGNWHAVESNSTDIVVNAGDMLQMATNYYFKSTTHRVVNPEGSAANTPRFSMPFFLHFKPEVRLSENYTAQQYFDERMREILG